MKAHLLVSLCFTLFWECYFSSYTLLYATDMENETKTYFNNWDVSTKDITGYNYWFHRQGYHRYENKGVEKIKKIYNTVDPHFRILINYEIFYQQISVSPYCPEYYDPDAIHTKNLLCQHGYHWTVGEDFTITTIDGNPFKDDSFDATTATKSSFSVKYSKTLDHTRETLTIEFEPFNSKWNLFATLRNIYIYYEVCDDSCDCVACSSSGTCQSCENGTYWNSSTSSCKPCIDINCYSCFSANGATCSSCKTGYFLDSATNSCVIKSSSLSPPFRGINNLWVQSPSTSCQIWDKNALCILESTNSVLVSPAACSPGLNCDACSQLFSCDSCLPSHPIYFNNHCSASCTQMSYFLSGSTCKRCDPTCLTCNGPLDTNCLTCRENEYFMDAQHSCVTCLITQYPDDVADTCKDCASSIPNCNACISNNNSPICTSCDVGYYLEFGICNLTCSSSSKANSATNKCEPCYEGCLNCAEFNFYEQCNICAATYFHHKSTYCVKDCSIYSGYFNDSSTMKCEACSDQNCETCSGKGATCTRCKYYTELKNGMCEYCASNQFMSLDTLKCENCKANCKFCTNSFECTQCESGYFYDKKAYNYPCVQSCSGTQIGNTSTQLCVACPKGTYKQDNLTCVACPSGCASCLPNGKCLLCFPNYIINRCTSSLSNQCTKCANANQYSIGTASHCFNCDARCATCSGPGNTNCETCVDSYYFVANMCLACDVSCATCIGDQSYCQTCAAGYNYYSVRIVKSISSSALKQCYSGSCPSSMVIKPGTMECIQCFPLCSTCIGTGETECQTCKPNLSGFPIFLHKTTCVLVCPSGYYADLVSLKCVACDVACSVCVGSGPLNCTTCANNYFLDSGNACVKYCGNGNYGDAVTLKCEVCPTQCATCVSATKCSSCPGVLFLQPDYFTCAADCPTDSIKNQLQRLCTGCPSNCSTCTTIQKCASCKSNYSLSQNYDCVSDCGSKQYTSAGRCVACASGCEQCSESGCSQCSQGQIAYQNICVEECPDDYSESNGKCVLTKELVRTYMQCYLDCNKEKEFGENTDNVVRSLAIGQTSMNGFGMFFGGLGSHFFYWIQMQQILGNMVFLQNSKALGVGLMHLKNLYLENLFNAIPLSATDSNIVVVFSGRFDPIFANIQPQNIYTYFITNCRYGLFALCGTLALIPLLFLLSKYSELCQLLYAYCKWNIVIRVMMIASNYFLLCVFFRIKVGSPEGGETISLIDIGAIVAFLVFYSGMFAFIIYYNSQETLDPSRMSSLNAFYYDLDLENTTKKSFWVFFEIRKILVCLTVVFTEGGIASPWIYFILSVIFLTYCYKNHPFKKDGFHRYLIVSETLSLVCILFLCFVVSFSDNNASLYFAYAFVVMLLVYQLWSIITQLYELGQLLITLFLKYREPPTRRRRTRQNSPSLNPLFKKMEDSSSNRSSQGIDLTTFRFEEVSSPKRPRPKF